MSAFKKGDRVVVYGGAGPHTLESFHPHPLFCYGRPATVVDADDCGLPRLRTLTVLFDARGVIPEGHEAQVHVKQCRRLVKRRKK